MAQTGPSTQEIAQMQAAMAAEAKRRGLTPQQFQEQQRAQIAAEAMKQGLTFEQYVEKLKQQTMENHRRQQMEAQRQQQQQQQSPPETPGSPPGTAMPIKNDGNVDPRALALAKWLRTQNLKMRTCILNGQRKDMFRGAANSSSFAQPFPIFVRC